MCVVKGEDKISCLEMREREGSDEKGIEWRSSEPRNEEWTG